MYSKVVGENTEMKFNGQIGLLIQERVNCGKTQTMNGCLSSSGNGVG